MVQQQPEYGTCRSRPQRRTPPKKLRIRFAMHFARLSRLLVAHGLCSCIGDIVYFDRKTHKRVVLEITRVAITQASISGSGVLAGPDAVLSILRARERERRRCAGISCYCCATLFIPIVLTSCGGFGPSAQKYLKYIYGRARENSCRDIGVGQPDIQTTWSTPRPSMYWNVRLSVAGAANDAQVQSDILLSGFTRNLVKVGRQPYLDPNFASSGRPHCLVVALPRAA